MRWPAHAVVALLLLLGCGGDHSPIRVEDVRPSYPGGELQPVKVSSRTAAPEWRLNTGRIQRPFAVYAVGDTLAIVLDRGFPFMHLVQSRTGEYLHPLMSNSADDLEPFPVHRIAVSPHDPTEFAAFDITASAFVFFRLGDQLRPLEQLRSLQLNFAEVVDWPIWNTDNSISVEPVRVETLRARITPDGRLVEHGGVSLSGFGPSWVPSAIRRDAAEGQSCAAPDRERIARSFMYMGLVLFLDSNGDLLPGVHPDLFFDPSFVVHESSEIVFGAQTAGARTAYRSCAATNSMVVGLFSGMNSRQGGGRGQMAFGARQVHIYNWRGALTRGFRLERDAVWIDVAPNGKRLIVIESGVVPTLAGYAL